MPRSTTTWPTTPAPYGPRVSPVPQIARELVIPLGENKGENPSIATVYRLLAEGDAATETGRPYTGPQDQLIAL